MPDEQIRPDYYGGRDSIYQPTKVARAWGISCELFSALKYICRAGKKSPDRLTDLRKARTYIEMEIEEIELEEKSAKEQAA